MAINDSSDKLRAEIFHKLIEVVPDLMTIDEAGSSSVDGYMDLGLDVLVRTPERILIALSHYYRHPSGDMIPDPDMEVAVFPNVERAEATSYQDICCYHSIGIGEAENVQCQRDLNVFLSQWLSNLIKQGHRITTDEQARMPGESMANYGRGEHAASA